MGQNNTSELKRGIDLKPGIFIVRYALAEEVNAHPIVKVSIDDVDQFNVFLVLQDLDKKRDITLWQPGTSVVLKVVRPGRISIEVIPLIAGASTNATIKIDAVSQGSDHYETIGQAPGHSKQDLNLAGIRLYGHVAGRGDIEVPADVWLAGPTMPARIEGIAIQWVNKPRTIDLRYSTIGPRSNAAASPMVNLGGFAGTRGRALPVLGLALELTGAGTASVQLVVEALFLGAPIMRSVGLRATLSGPSGLEPLIGLKVGIEEKLIEAKPETTGVSSVTHDSASASAAPARPVRIFRSKAASTTG